MEDDNKEDPSYSLTRSATNKSKLKENLVESSEISEVGTLETPKPFEVQMQSENANTFSYLLGIFENSWPRMDVFDKAHDFTTVMLENPTPIIADEDEITKGIEDELFIQSTEPASNSLILSIEPNNSGNNVPLNNSKNLSDVNQITQPIPSITPSKIKTQAPLEGIRGSQIIRVKDSQKSDTTHEGKRGSRMDYKNTKTVTIQKENNNEKEPQSPADVLTDEANITISFKFRNNQGSQSQNLHQKIIDTDSHSEVLKEKAIHSVDLNVASCSGEHSPVSLITKLSFAKDPRKSNSNISFLILSGSMTRRSSQSGTTKQVQSLISPISLITTEPNEPQSLFLQALGKLKESSISVTKLNRRQNATTSPIANASETKRSVEPFYAEYTPPDSLTCAPPSYSFVVRQSARRRPRLLGTFFPSSPSFVRKTPPPSYAAAFDIYVDSPLPSQARRMYNYGFTEMLVICPECGYAGLTFVISKVTLCTHICAFLLCLFCCWICAPLPYIMRSCKDVYHYCRNCRNLLGIYRPYTPESAYNFSSNL